MKTKTKYIKHWLLDNHILLWPGSGFNICRSCLFLSFTHPETHTATWCKLLAPRISSHPRNRTATEITLPTLPFCTGQFTSGVDKVKTLKNKYASCSSRIYIYIYIYLSGCWRWNRSRRWPRGWRPLGRPARRSTWGRSRPPSSPCPSACGSQTPLVSHRLLLLTREP